jgi:TPR repeat protein
MLAGAPAERDVSAGLLLLAAACGSGDTCACVERGAALQTFDGRVAAMGEALRLFQDACQAPSKTQCSPSRTAASSVFAERITPGASTVEMLACYNLSQMLGRGLVTAPDPVDAELLAKRACAAGLVRACGQ